MDQFPFYVSCAIVIGGFLLFCCGIVIWSRMTYIKKLFLPVSGRVIDMHGGCPCAADAKSETYYPVIEYSVKDRKYKILGKSKVSCEQYVFGETVELYYSPYNPGNAVLKKEIHYNPFCFTFGGLGFMFLGTCTLAALHYFSV